SNEIAYFQVLARGSAIRFLLTRLYDWLNHPDDALVQPKDPMSYLKKLNFHQQVENSKQYGFIV
ncbi:homoserine kinase, partial [bacterium]|nr:homoserine kinase [bacterium]